MRTFSTVGRLPSATRPSAAIRRVAEQRAQPRRRVVSADDADERHLRAERRQVLRDVRGAAQTRVFALESHDGHRCLRRDPRHPSDDEPIEHHVADDAAP